MNLPVSVVVEVVVSAALWLGVLVAVAAIAAVAVHWIMRRSVDGLRRTLLVAVATAAVVMAIAHRLNAPDPLAVMVGRRDLLITWAVVGALAGAVAVSRLGRSPDGQTADAEVLEPSGDTPPE